MANPSIIDVLSAQYGIPGKLSIGMGAGDLPVMRVENEVATAVISIYAGHVLSYQPKRQPKGQPDVLWMSKEAVFDVDQPIRGGIPVIWPWFGPHPTDGNQFAHGFARRMMWGVKETGEDENGRIHITLELTETEETKDVFSHDFELKLTIVVGLALEVTLIVENKSDAEFSYTAALHSYFNISNIDDISIRGLEGVTYLDQLDDMQRKEQVGPIQFTEETDRIYVETTAVCEIIDPGLNRVIWIDKRGSESTVVWNPWIEKSQRMADFGDDEYRSMVCVETANAADDVVMLEPGEVGGVTAVIGTKQL
ncbi:MAG: D-hexose-6-phosphate mutarotase [Chloroflexi bacterium]|nr:MAG: D-hexose-6-phosphate mutarotase [Chloroflexota bacterium]